jgi:hypothetical protein
MLGSAGGWNTYGEGDGVEVDMVESKLIGILV